MMAAVAAEEEVDFVSGKTRLFGIVGDPIAQVRSPEMATYELRRRGLDALLVPLHVRHTDFDRVMPEILKIHNLDGLIFTIPFKARAMALAQVVGPQARAVGALNALARQPDGRWAAEIFDGLGCVEAFRRRGYGLAGQRVMLIGLGGAGSAICAAVASERPRSMRLFDLDIARAEHMAAQARALSPSTEVTIGAPTVEGMDVLFNASPVGMLGTGSEGRLPIDVARLPGELVVFDAIVKPELTPLVALAETCGCRTVRGREMMRGQMAKLVDFFISTGSSASANATTAAAATSTTDTNGTLAVGPG